MGGTFSDARYQPWQKDWSHPQKVNPPKLHTIGGKENASALWFCIPAQKMLPHYQGDRATRARA